MPIDFTEFEAACTLAGLKIYVPRGGNNPNSMNGRWIAVHDPKGISREVDRIGLEFAAMFGIALEDCYPKRIGVQKGTHAGTRFSVRKSAFGEYFGKIPMQRTKTPKISKHVAAALALVKPVTS